MAEFAEIELIDGEPRMHIVSTGTQLCDKCGKPMGNARVANSQGTFHAECAGFSPFARIAELEAALRRIYGAVYDPEGMSDAKTLDLVLSLSGNALGLTKSD